MTHHTFISPAFFRLFLPVALLLAVLAAACGRHGDATDLDASVAEAEQSLADGQPDRAARICADLMANDFDKLNERQLGRMAVIFMKLPESDCADENVAEATQCVRQAWKLSSDSLRGFLSTLPPEDLPHIVMLTRISGSIDFPPDLSEDHYADDSVHVSHLH